MTLGLVLGLGGPVTFQNARRLHALVPQLRLDRLVLETDAPYLAPHPHRGQRNEPAYVPLIAESLARFLAQLANCRTTNRGDGGRAMLIRDDSRSEAIGQILACAVRNRCRLRNP